MNTNLKKLKALLATRRNTGTLIFNLKNMTDGVALVCDGLVDEVLYKGAKREEFLKKAFPVLRDFIIQNPVLSLELDFNKSEFLNKVLNTCVEVGTIKRHKLRLEFEQYIFDKKENRDSAEVYQEIQEQLLALRLEIGYPVHIERSANYQVVSLFDEGVNEEKVYSTDDFLSSYPLLGEIETFPNNNIYVYNIYQDCDLIIFKQMFNKYFNSYGTIDSTEFAKHAFHYSVSTHGETITPYNNMIDFVLYGKYLKNLTRNDLTEIDIKYCDDIKEKTLNKHYNNQNDALVNIIKREEESLNRMKAIHNAVLNNDYCIANKIDSMSVYYSVTTDHNGNLKLIKDKLDLPDEVLKQIQNAL